ncbi:hypothetical protein U1839_20005 [Sphingomonas sp. RT2P30]|uniref:hypothetical protein n=1 Tax=Parasphingomonas halimpatiens TaxID=3096162 RepID=UPI002FC73ADB
MTAILMMLAAAATTVSYDCVLEPPQTLITESGKPSLNPLQLGGVTADNWKFTVQLVPKGIGREAKVLWAGDPIQIAGAHPVVPTSAGSVAIVAAAAGPCMFTETGCVTVVHLVDDANGAKVTIMPTALASDSAAHTRAPFTVIIEGRCSRSEGSK